MKKPPSIELYAELRVLKRSARRLKGYAVFLLLLNSLLLVSVLWLRDLGRFSS